MLFHIPEPGPALSLYSPLLFKEDMCLGNMRSMRHSLKTIKWNGNKRRMDDPNIFFPLHRLKGRGSRGRVGCLREGRVKGILCTEQFLTLLAQNVLNALFGSQRDLWNYGVQSNETSRASELVLPITKNRAGGNSVHLPNSHFPKQYTNQNTDILWEAQSSKFCLQSSKVYKKPLIGAKCD